MFSLLELIEQRMEFVMAKIIDKKSQGYPYLDKSVDIYDKGGYKVETTIIKGIQEIVFDVIKSGT